MSMLVNTGHSTGTFSGSTTGVGATLGGGLGAGVGRFSGSSSSDHFGKVDLCVPCCEDRLEQLRKRLAEITSLAVKSFFVMTLVGILICTWQNLGSGGLIAAVIVAAIVGVVNYQPAGAVKHQINSAVRNGRRRTSPA
jgi:hypothetical protein